MKNFKQIVILVQVFFVLHLSAQNHKFANKISRIENQWHIIELDKEILSKVNRNLSDIRILSISESDTIEVPYFFKERISKKNENIAFELINKSNIGDNYFFSLKLENSKAINEIILNFKQQNFNWQVELQASQNQKEWFTILYSYRILAIKNKLTNYNFTKLLFPKSEYKYYRIKIKSKEKPLLKSATLRNNIKYEKDIVEIKNTYKVKPENKKTIIEINLEDRIPISEIKIDFIDKIDFQRPLQIDYLVDSFKTEVKWIYNFNNVHNTYVSSLEENLFDFKPVFTNKLKLTINNYDNEKLQIKSIKTFSPKYEIIARFNHLENKHLIVYGDKEKQAPNYDIVNFKQNIPKELKLIKIGEQVKLEKTSLQTNSIANKWWLWSIIIVIILMLAYSTIGMLKKD